jgi:flagellar hook assembly protein FlgD
MFTTNAGANWITEESTNDWYDCLTYYQKIKSWCGASGKVWYTSLVTKVNPEQKTIPKNFGLYQNYPNPFNPVTKIKFDVPSESNVNITIYNTLGKEISSIVNKKMTQGSYEVNWDASNYPSGIYYYRLSAGNYTFTQKMILLK